MNSIINLDIILSDPMLLTGTALFLLGPIGFIFALFKYFSTKEVLETYPEIPSENEEPPVEQRNDSAKSNSIPEPEPQPSPSPEPAPPAPPESVSSESVETTVQSNPPKPPPQPEPPPPPKSSPKSEKMEEKTVVIPPIINDLQSQIEIAYSQIKNLNHKMSDLDQQVELLERHQNVKLETNELKEPPTDPADFTQKLLKLAEHVIMLEKEVSRLRSASKSSQPLNPSDPPQTQQNPSPPVSENPPNPSKPPIMPL